MGNTAIRLSGLRAFGRKARALARDEDGQAITEYILILTAAVVAAGLISRAILSAIDTGILTLGGQLEKDLKTGRTPLSVYKN